MNTSQQLAQEIVWILTREINKDQEEIKKQRGESALAATHQIRALLNQWFIQEPRHTELWRRFQEHPNSAASQFKEVMTARIHNDAQVRVQLEALVQRYNHSIDTVQQAQQLVSTIGTPKETQP